MEAYLKTSGRFLFPASGYRQQYNRNPHEIKEEKTMVKKADITNR